MPYIEQERRRLLDPHIDAILEHDKLELRPGDIAYIVFRLMRYYWQRNPSFTTWATLRGTINDQVDEFRARYAGPYEAGKRVENGDVQ